MKNIIIFLLFCLPAFNCTDEKTAGEYDSLEINSELNQYSKLNISTELFELIDSIQTDNSSDAVIGIVWDALKFNNHFIIADPFGSKFVKIFDENGSFIQNLGSSGEGPGEYEVPDKIAGDAENIAVYDPTQMKVILFGEQYNFISSWKVKYPVEDLVLHNNMVITLRKPSPSNDYDIDLYDHEGKLKEQILLPESSRKQNKQFLFGGSYKILSGDNKIFYVGADEYHILCYDLSQREIIWGSGKAGVIRIPDIPADLNSRKRIQWMKQNYTSLRGFYLFDNGLLVIHIPGYFLLYDDRGNFLSQMEVEDKGRIFFAEGNNLVEVRFPFKVKDEIFNPAILTYKIREIKF